MALGPGKYDEPCEMVRTRMSARGVVLLVFEGIRGSGFSVQADPQLMMHLPALLRSIADDIEQDMRE